MSDVVAKKSSEKPNTSAHLPAVKSKSKADLRGKTVEEKTMLVDDFRSTPGRRKIMVIKIPQTDKEDIREKVLAYRVEPHIIFSKFFEQLLINLHHLFHHHLLSFEVISYKQHIHFYVY